LYATYDVTENLKPGGNAVGVILGNGRFFAPRLSVPVPTVTFGFPKLLLNLRIEYADGSTRDLITDEMWTITTEGPTRTNSEYDGEEYDARLEMDGWAEAGFNDAKWRPVQIVKPPGGALHAQMIEPVRVTEYLRPVSITEPRPGVFVADFGQAFYGSPQINVKGPAGTRVEMRSSFNVRPDGTLNTDNDRTAQNTDVYTLRGDGYESWRPRFKGTAIRRVQVTGFPGKLQPSNLDGLVIHTDHEPVGEFASSNELINRIYANARWGTRMQNRSIPMEPDRDERQGWSGHPAKTSESEGFAFNVAPFYASWLHSVRLDQHADGALQEISPGYWTFASKGTIWPAIVTIVPNWMYDFYGDRRAVADNYGAMKKWVEYHVRTNQKPDGTLDHSSYPDWVDASWIGKRHDEPSSGTASMPFISTAYHYHNLRLTSRAAGLLGKSDDAAKFETIAAKVKEGFNARFFKPAEDRYDFGNQFSYILPLAFGLVPDADRKAVIDNLLWQTMETDKGHTTVGLLGMQWQMQVLSDIGHPEVAYAIATKTDRPSWGYMIGKGATTIWERWDTDTQDGGMNGESQKILSGNFEAWCYQTLAGINYDPERPGFKHVILRPRAVGDLTWAKASYESMYGEIRSEWRLVTGGDGRPRFEYDFIVPPNTTATVYVRGREVKDVRRPNYGGHGDVPRRYAKDEASAFRQDGDDVTFDFAPGQYRYEWELK
jgi:alpha-L-rhamnosidase